jgi:YggT family protein
VENVVQFLNVLVSIYLLAIFLYVLTSWFRLPYSLRPVQNFLYELCEPYLRFWRRLLPFRFGPLDLTPIIAIFALVIGWQILAGVLLRLD